MWLLITNAGLNVFFGAFHSFQLIIFSLHIKIILRGTWYVPKRGGVH